MALLVAIIVVAALLVGFLSLTRLEQARGARILPSGRKALDGIAVSLFSLVVNTEERSTLLKKLGGVLEHVLHDTVHKALLGVRILERSLTKAARHLRGRQAAKATEEKDAPGPLG